jgi:hypothetical protein
MDTFEEIGPFKVRMMNPEKSRYSLEKPNPDWERLGLQWLDIARGDLDSVLSVAYIPHSQMEISVENHIYERLPVYRDRSDPERSNLVLGRYLQKGEEKNLFRLYAWYQPLSGPIGGQRANVDLSPADNPSVPLDLLRIAERIFHPPSLD